MSDSPSAVIFDVDGTLCDVSGVRHYVTKDPKRRNFEKFHGAAILCPPNQWVVDLSREYCDQGTSVIVVTSRRERWRYKTSMWLRKWGIDYTILLMRADDDDRPDVDVKRSILNRIRETYEVIAAVDDNPSILALWEAAKIPTIVTVPGWFTEEES